MARQAPYVILLEVVFLTLFWAWVLSAALFLRNTLLPRQPLFTAPTQLNLPFETITFPATDGLRLEGWTIPDDPSRPWIILCHGLGSNRSDLLNIAAGLHEARFNLLLFDFRGHGGSAGRATSFGWIEQRDLEGALSFLGRHATVQAAPYGVYGISMGGAVALAVAGRDERLLAVAADSPYTTLDDSLAIHLKLLYPFLPRQPFLTFVRWTYRLRFGAWPASMSPLAGAAALSPRSLLLIQGGSDARVPLAGAHRLFDAARDPKDLWVIREAVHLEEYALDPAAYRRRLALFFDTALK